MNQRFPFLCLGLAALLIMLSVGGCANWGTADPNAAPPPPNDPNPATSPAQFPANY